MSRPVPPMLADLLDGIPDGMNRAITGVTQDSREVGSGNLFIARSGLNSHGLDFYSEVVAKGAAAVLAEPDSRWPAGRMAEMAAADAIPVLPVDNLGMRASAVAGAYYGNPSAALRVIGVTGTNGKTSCSLALATILSNFTDAIFIGTLGHGRPGQVRPGSHTTPDAVSLQRLLAGYLDEGAGAVVMEVSSHALEQGRVEAIHFDTAVFTNLSRDHLDYHGDMAAYGKAKARLFRFPGLGLVVINADDPFAEQLIWSLTDDVRLALYGSHISKKSAGRADRVIKTEQVRTTTEGLHIRLRVDGAPAVLKSRWLGGFNAENLMAVLTVLLEQGIALERALELLAEVSAPAGRMEAFGGGERALVVVDYAHTPDALEKVLQALREHCAGQLVCVFGCGGDRDRGKRPQMGVVAERLADRIVLTDDNPRSESGDSIIKDILAGVENPDAIRIQRDRAAAIESAVAEAVTGDVVAVCGKGHETTQSSGGVIHEFSDRRMVAGLLGEAVPC